MQETLEWLKHAAVIGIGATAFMDLWAVLMLRLFKIPALNYALVGRWLGHMPSGRFIHDNIARAAPIGYESWLGWGAHYGIGIGFAALLLTLCGLQWAYTPTLLPALLFGIVTVTAPFFIMQPGMGAGIAASKTPAPKVARRRSLMAHTSFGLGLYVAASLLTRV
ncbi:DUF2938 domain-containing protein [Shewanella sp. AS16]|uniref:DUF2938 domain-containing protein n=1 Tax=Shewanella sp. AS16 TaxID=2907625 RepID=UPI001F34423E|nr:DUF2938 domain-containing protein [Shewanella sp. AS16]MCE9685059.1 DUF2938 domain-containing protein [Shewanella sp. AS16]